VALYFSFAFVLRCDWVYRLVFCTCVCCILLAGEGRYLKALDVFVSSSCIRPLLIMTMIHELLPPLRTGCVVTPQPKAVMLRLRRAPPDIPPSQPCLFLRHLCEVPHGGLSQVFLVYIHCSVIFNGFASDRSLRPPTGTRPHPLPSSLQLRWQRCDVWAHRQNYASITSSCKKTSPEIDEQKSSNIQQQKNTEEFSEHIPAQ